MRHTIYKSLDKPSSLFGLKGSYLTICVAGAGIGLFIAAILGSATNGLVGTLAFVGFAALSYFATLRFQAKFSERERAKWLSSRNLPDFITVPPRRLSFWSKVTFKTGTRDANAE